MTINHDKPLIQLAKYAIVGVMNTLLTLAVIFICKSLLGVNPYISNALGYIVGLINSFLWNRSWVFRRRDGKLSRQAILFLIGFAVCYGLQFFTVSAKSKYESRASPFRATA